ncbi:GDSL-type esterase/lipase family protein [Chitinophaga sp.]|uniref:GDSL-type esterase/lipase family protein n=1 Tax=Chitinophaga sp. TaxID=1869181 RepID=UPI00263529F9|nr:GDSL-type esterase/lipase family protein [uncultured Chitinophaga sp.]
MIRIFAALFITIACWHSAAAQSPVRIACVGNSITYGSGVADRDHNSYPAQLQNMLGKGYTVGNFGQSGATALTETNNSYRDSKAYADAIAFRPDIVFIKLGTNDSKRRYAGEHGRFEADYKSLVAAFRQLPSKPRVVVLLPVASFVTDTASDNAIYQRSIQQNIVPYIRKIAYEEKLDIIDLYPLFADKPDLFPDKIHPSSLGATLIAKRLYEQVTAKPGTPFDIFTRIKERKQFSSFHGFECADFISGNRACKVVKPKTAAPGRPWIWRARFWGHEPQLDISLLERGFHVAYCDVAELFGNPAAINAWNRFYKLLTGAGLSAKVSLEGMSRGGVYIYNWALANPGKVASIYADAPVLDLKSWPGGLGKGPGSKGDWDTFKKDYQLDEAQATAFTGSPLDNAANIARLGIPMLHVVGDADEVVPVDENTGPFEAKIKAAGGNITVIHKPGVKHHPHSLQDPTPITNFILASSGRKINFAAIPAPGAEYRSGAGWAEGKGWWQQFANIDSLISAGARKDIVFLGNSITQGTGGHRTYVPQKPGFAVFDSLFGQFKWESAGISGDKTQNVLFRLQQGAIAAAPPKVIAVSIGVNNLPAGDSPQEIAAGIQAIAEWINKRLPKTQLILSGPLPTGLQKDSERRKQYDAIHAILAKKAATQKRYTYFPLTAAFVQADGSLSLGDYSADGIHLTTGGYRKWALALQPVIMKYLEKIR